MAKVRVTLIDGRVVDGKITIAGKPVLVVDGKPHSVMDAVLKGMSVWPIDDPIFERWQKTYM